MPLIKLSHICSFSSEDPKNKAENLLNGRGKWLSHPNDNSGTIKIELQLERAAVINYVDIGNNNTAMINIEVGMSSWPPSLSFLPLLPTVVLMNPIESRSGINSTTVRMFKSADFDQKNAPMKWDRIRITCVQLFKKNCQFGLAFVNLYSDGPDVQTEISSPIKVIKEDNGKYLSNSLKRKRLELHASKYIASPNSRSAQIIAARKPISNQCKVNDEKMNLEKLAISYLFSMNLTCNDIKTLKVSDIREQFEHMQGRRLNPQEKMVFKNIALDFATRRLSELESKMNASIKEPITLSSDEESENAGRHLRKQKYTFKKLDLIRSPSTNRSPSHSKVSPKVQDDGHCSTDIFSKEIYSQDEDCNSQCISSSDNHESPLVSKNRKQIECPLCTKLFSSFAIEEHAANCNGSEFVFNHDNGQKDELLPELAKENQCPVCDLHFEESSFASHVEQCADEKFS